MEQFLAKTAGATSFWTSLDLRKQLATPRTGKMLSTTLLTLVLSQGGHAAKLFSGGLYINDGTLTSCSVVNVSNKSLKIRAQILAFDGFDVTDSSDCGLVRPSRACGALYTNDTRGSELVYCKISVEASERTVRGTFGIRDCDITCENTVAIEVR